MSIRAEPGERRLRDGLQIALRRQVGEHPVDQRRPRPFSSIAPTIAITSSSRVIDPPGGGGEIGPLDPRQRLERPLGGQAVGMAGEGLRPPGARRDRAGIVGVVAQARVGVLAHPQERLLVEARRVDGEPQKFDGAVEILHQRAHPADTWRRDRCGS